MSANGRRPDAKKQRKHTLRQMKALERKIAGHAQAHRDLVARHWAETTLSEKQVQAILRRIDRVLMQLPVAMRHAHERIIGERPVPHAEKLLSLYEPDVAVLKQGTVGADVEFGNKLWLGETRAGLIVDFALLPEVEADSTLVLPAVERLRGPMKIALQQVWCDRGLFSRKNEQALARGVSAAACARAIRPSCKVPAGGRRLSGRPAPPRRHGGAHRDPQARFRWQPLPGQRPAGAPTRSGLGGARAQPL